MAERFDAYYDSISCKSTGKHIHDDGEFVLASDYAALAAELARVKAESLRVVPDGGEAPFWCLDGNDPLFSHEGKVHCRRFDVMECFVIEGCFMLHRPDDEAIVQPVRLERWEANDDHH